MTAKRKPDGLAPTLVIGAVAGVVASVAMTGVAAGLFRMLPPRDRYPLPPREITDGLIKRHLGNRPGESARVAATLVSHFGFGAAAGAAHSGIFRSRHQTAFSTIAYAIAVWIGSYFGWAPAFRLLRPASSHPFERNILMIAAHVVWGTVLWTSGRILKDSLEPFQHGPLLDCVHDAPTLYAEGQEGK